MTPFLVDVNVWLALMVREHVHHAGARAWFASLQPGEAALCRFVQIALVRLLGTPAVMGPGALSASEAWSRVSELLEDERVEFAAEPPGLDSILPGLFLYPVPTRNLIADAYLAAFAMSANLRFLTRDRGFQQFRGLRVEILKD